MTNWFGKEQITEDYDQKNFTVTITKIKGKTQSTQVIKKKTPIQNPILMPHYVRRIPELSIGTVITTNLALSDFEMKLIGIEDIKVPAGTFKAYHFESTPKQVEIWITADQRRIPIKIQGSGVFGYCMVMREYVAPQREKGSV